RLGTAVRLRRITVVASGENSSTAPATRPRMLSRSSSSVRPAVNASHHGRNLSVGPENAFTTAFACDLATDDEPRKIVVTGTEAPYLPSPRGRDGARSSREKKKKR